MIIKVWRNGRGDTGKQKKLVSKEYADFMREDNIKIHWIKIQSHTEKKME